jgi:hypothetical protein
VHLQVETVGDGPKRLGGIRHAVHLLDGPRTWSTLRDLL